MTRQFECLSLLHHRLGQLLYESTPSVGAFSPDGQRSKRHVFDCNARDRRRYPTPVALGRGQAVAVQICAGLLVLHVSSSTPEPLPVASS